MIDVYGRPNRSQFAQLPPAPHCSLLLTSAGFEMNPPTLLSVDASIFCPILPSPTLPSANTHTHTHTYAHTYAQRERERERERPIPSTPHTHARSHARLRARLTAMSLAHCGPLLRQDRDIPL